MSSFIDAWKILLCIVFLGKMANAEALFNRRVGIYFDGHVFSKKQANSEVECGIYCMRESSCVSANFKFRGNNTGSCELNDEMVEDFPRRRIQNRNFIYLGIIRRSCHETKQIFSRRNRKCTFFKTCKEILEDNENAQSGVYRLQGQSQPYDAFCYMTAIPGCDNEASAWTLIMKINGKKTTFKYRSPYWTNKETYGVEDGLEGLTEKESKLASYWNTPFKKICLGMTVNGDRRWMALDYEASSLYSLIADNKQRNTSAGFNKWTPLIQNVHYWHKKCKKEGFNVKGERFISRVAFVSNDLHQCPSVGTAIGFGMQFENDKCVGNRVVSAGYAFTCESYIATKAFGYILVS